MKKTKTIKKYDPNDRVDDDNPTHVAESMKREHVIPLAERAGYHMNRRVEDEGLSPKDVVEDSLMDARADVDEMVNGVTPPDYEDENWNTRPVSAVRVLSKLKTAMNVGKITEEQIRLFKENGFDPVKWEVTNPEKFQSFIWNFMEANKSLVEKANTLCPKCNGTGFEGFRKTCSVCGGSGLV